MLIEFVLIIAIFVAFGIRTYWFQTYLSQEATDYLTKELGKDVKIDKIDLIFFDEFDVKGVYVQDSKVDTLLYASNLNITLSDWSIEESFAHIDNVLLHLLHNCSVIISIYFYIQFKFYAS